MELTYNLEFIHLFVPHFCQFHLPSLISLGVGATYILSSSLLSPSTFCSLFLLLHVYASCTLPFNVQLLASWKYISTTFILPQRYVTYWCVLHIHNFSCLVNRGLLCIAGILSLFYILTYCSCTIHNAPHTTQSCLTLMWFSYYIIKILLTPWTSAAPVMQEWVNAEHLGGLSLGLTAHNIGTSTSRHNE
jgi:hypothetical protein